MYYSAQIFHYREHLLSTLGYIADNSPYLAHIYVFVTSNGDGNPKANKNLLGLAFVGTVCNRKRTYRVSLSRYGIPDISKNKILNTAEVIKDSFNRYSF